MDMPDWRDQCIGCSIFTMDVHEVLVATVPFVKIDIFHSSSDAQYGEHVAGQDVDGTQLCKYHKDIREITQVVSFWGCMVVVVGCICIQAHC